MVALAERVVRAAHRRETLNIRELVRLIEQSHTIDGSGVAWDILTEYAEALTAVELTLESYPDPGVSPERYAFTRGIFERELRAHTTDESTWVNETALYALTNDRISIYPPDWHEALSGTTDLIDCFTFIADATALQTPTREGPPESGITEQLLLGVATVIGGLAPSTAESRLAAAKERDEILEIGDRGSNPSLQLRTATETGEQALPPLLDIRDALTDIETSADTDVSDAIDDIRDALDEFDERDQAAQDSLVGAIESDINALREQVSEDADRRAAGIQHRLQQYRDTPAESSPIFSGAALRDDTDTPITLSEFNTTVARLSGTLVNAGDAGEVITVLTFYTDDDRSLRTIEGPPIELGPGEQHSVDRSIFIPPEATAYTAMAIAVDDPRARSERPEP